MSNFKEHYSLSGPYVLNKAFFCHSLEKKSGSELNFTPENTPHMFKLHIRNLQVTVKSFLQWRFEAFFHIVCYPIGPEWLRIMYRGTEYKNTVLLVAFGSYFGQFWDCMEALEELIEAILRLISPPFSGKIWPNWPQIRYIGTDFGLKKGWCHNFDFPWFR